MKWLVGVDEAGRGPLAGPVAVGAVKVASNFDWELIPGVTDSKKLLPQRREDLFRLAHQLKRDGIIDFSVVLVGPKIIDERGIARAIPLGIARAMQRMALDPAECHCKLDGLLRAPAKFTHQETIVKGDLKEKVIGLASIIAKVTRDRYMCRLAQRAEFAAYLFETHKGYATPTHRALIKQHGLTDLHRTSYCRNFISL